MVRDSIVGGMTEHEGRTGGTVLCGLSQEWYARRMKIMREV